MTMMGKRAPKENGADRFGRQLRALRDTRGWTQTELAKAVGIDRSIIGNYELGLHYPPIPTLIKLARALGTTVDRLLDADEKKIDDIQDRRLHQLFLEADRADFAKQGLVKQVLESLLRPAPAGKDRTGTNG